MKTSTKRIIQLLESEMDDDCTEAEMLIRGLLANKGYEESLLELKYYFQKHKQENIFLSETRNKYNAEVFDTFEKVRTYQHDF